MNKSTVRAEGYASSVVRLLAGACARRRAGWWHARWCGHVEGMHPWRQTLSRVAANRLLLCVLAGGTGECKELSEADE
jgi:hypothetical protein